MSIPAEQDMTCFHCLEAVFLPLGLRRASAPGAGLAPTPAQFGMARGDDPLLGPAASEQSEVHPTA